MKANHVSGEKASGLVPSPRIAVAITIIIVLALGTTYAVFALHLIDIGSTPSQQHFTIIITNQGFNGSRTHSDPWPVMNIKKGDTVTFHVQNADTTEPHGFAITHYLDSGVKLSPGQSDDVTFTANQAGTFLVYCNIFCTIHVYMQNGQLNVTT